jgi:hypothetical protein
MPKRRNAPTVDTPAESRALVEQTETDAEPEPMMPDEVVPEDRHGRAAEYRKTNGEVFRQHITPQGVVQLDRKLTPEEAAAQDAAHREVYAQNRARRFGAPSDWERVYGPHYSD